MRGSSPLGLREDHIPHLDPRPQVRESPQAHAPAQAARPAGPLSLPPSFPVRPPVPPAQSCLVAPRLSPPCLCRPSAHKEMGHWM